VAGRSIRPLSRRLNLDIVSASPRWGDGSTRCARAQTAYGSSWRCSRPITTFVLPHASLRQPLLTPEATHGRGSARLGAAVHASDGAGLTDHVWSLQEVLLCRVPPWPQTQMV